jgi:hypothetical protein
VVAALLAVAVVVTPALRPLRPTEGR